MRTLCKVVECAGYIDPVVLIELSDDFIYVLLAMAEHFS